MLKNVLFDYLLNFLVFSAALTTALPLVQVDFFNSTQRINDGLLEGETRTYNFSLGTKSEFVVFLFNESVDISITAAFSVPGDPIVPCSRYSDLIYGQGCLFHPAIAQQYCSGAVCFYTLNVTSLAATPIWYGIQIYWGEMFPQYNRLYTDRTERGYDRFYGLQVTASDLTVLVGVVPDERYPDMGIDVYMYNQDSPLLTPFFPNVHASNNPNNEEQDVLIRSDDSYWMPGLFILRVHIRGGFQAPNRINYFNLYALRNYEDPILVSLPVFAIVAVLVSVVVCGFGTAACFARRLYRNHDDQAGENMGRPPPGASVEQIRGLGTVVFHTGDIQRDDAKCSICLSDYEDNETLRNLPCGHQFHVPCIDTWLLKNRHCPLCQQDIRTAKEVGNFHEQIVASHTPQQPPTPEDEGNRSLEGQQQPREGAEEKGVELIAGHEEQKQSTTSAGVGGSAGSELVRSSSPILNTMSYHNVSPNETQIDAIVAKNNDSNV